MVRTWSSTGVGRSVETGEITDGAVTEPKLSDAAKDRFPMGDSSAKAQFTGVAKIDTTSAGTVGTGEDILITYEFPADSLASNGQGIKITAWGTTGANANGKIVKLHFGSTVIRQIGSSAINDKDWLIMGIIIRTGVGTQDAIGTEIVETQALNTHSEPAEDETAAITIKITGEGTANDDVVAQGFLVEFLN